jgi:NAD(P)-dependent dehydrogenase (short-subunit alcohol dehydrogenase family)
VIDARRGDRLGAAEAELARQTKVVAIVGDVTKSEHRRRLVEAATGLGPITVVVNNASTLGASPLPRLDDIGADVLRAVFETNVIAPILLYQLALPHLGREAAVVNITSDAAVDGYAGWGGYGASKAALEQAGRVLAAERDDLRVLTIDPGDMRTEMHQDAFPGEDISDRPLPDASARRIADLVDGDTPSGRYSTHEVHQ